MRIFVFEWVCGGAPCFPTSGASRAIESSEEIPLGLLEEGFTMLHSIVDDFRRIHDVGEVVTLVDRSITSRLDQEIFSWPSVTVHDLTSQRAPSRAGLEALFDASVDKCDATLVIAPEFDGQLHDWTQRVNDRGGRLLGCDPEAVVLTADKLSLSKHLGVRSVPTPAAVAIDLNAKPEELVAVAEAFSLPWVIKPRFGAGCERTVMVKDTATASRALENLRNIGSTRELIATTFVSGRAASVSCLVGRDRVEVLAPGWQRILIDADGAMRYDGGVIGLSAERLNKRAIALAQRAIETIPGLRGFVGVDLVLGDGVGGVHDSVIEVNARLTSSYPLLKQHDTERNLAQEWLTITR